MASARRATAMHELSVMTQVVESVQKSLADQPVVRLDSVRLEIGELTMLGKEQLKFAWGILTEEGPLKGSKLIIVRKPALVECSRCGFSGPARKPADTGSHLALPRIACPKCGGEVRIVGGREVIIRSLRAVMDDGCKPKKRGRRR